MSGKMSAQLVDHSRELLRLIGEDPGRSGLLGTPGRVARMWAELTAGYDQDPARLIATFDTGLENTDQFIFQGAVPFASTCEHHLLPFFGVAHIGYIPGARVIGLSKIARLIDVYARRLQVQERLGAQIADILMEHLSPLGAGVVLQCRHMCMEIRGVRRVGTMTITSVLRGCIKTEPECRAEFMSLVANATQGMAIP